MLRFKTQLQSALRAVSRALVPPWLQGIQPMCVQPLIPCRGSAPHPGAAGAFVGPCMATQQTKAFGPG